MVIIYWTKLARNDLKNIFDYINQDSRKYALRQVKKIKNKTYLIKENIKIGRKVPEYDDERVRELIEGNYRIIYRIYKSDIVDIITIHHGARDLINRKLIED